MFDAMLDSVYSALEKVGVPTIEIVVSESGWAADQNGDVATVPNAQAYNNGLIEHVAGAVGTPKRPSTSIEAYVFALFNENLKPEGSEQHFGLYNPDMTPVYSVNFV